MDLGLYYYQARFYVPAIGRFASADSIVPDPANPQQYNKYTYTLNNPLRYSDPTGHRSCSPEQTATGDETCDENIINNEWLAFQRRMQAQLTGRYGYYGNRKVIFASGPNEYTPENVVTRPASIPELHAMIAAGEQAVLSLGYPTASCHPLAGAMNGYASLEGEDGYYHAIEDERYFQSKLNSMTDVIIFGPEFRAHSASVVLVDSTNPANTLLIQTNAGAHLSGIFFSQLDDTKNYFATTWNLHDINWVPINLPRQSPVRALDVTQPEKINHGGQSYE